MLASAVGMKAQEAYALLSSDGKTLTFFYDNLKSTRNGKAFQMNKDGEYPIWTNVSYDYRYNIKKVVFDSSFASYRPTNTYFWFFYMYNLTSIIDIQYLNTSEVTDMQSMFGLCTKITEIDVSHFDTSNVTDMYGMFYGCKSLTNIDVSQFNTSKVTRMWNMFVDCSSLKSIDVRNFETSNVTDMTSIFRGCSGLTRLDLSNFDMTNVTSSSNMLSNCSDLKSLSISPSMENIASNACKGVGTETNPCIINVPEGFDFGMDTSGDYFLWKSGYFTLGNSTPTDIGEIIVVPTDYGYMTHCTDKALDFTGRNDIKAYIISSYDGNIVYLSRVTTVPPETGLVLKAAAGSYLIPFISDDSYVVNMLKGVLVDTTIEPTEGVYTNFILADGNKGLGFYRVKEEGTIAAHRAYLQLPTRLVENNAKYIKIVFDDETTAIDGVTKREETSSYYDMQGVCHEGKPTKQGVYIMNGKKIVVK